MPSPSLLQYLRKSLLFFQAEDGIRDKMVTGVQTCALPIWSRLSPGRRLTAFMRIRKNKIISMNYERRDGPPAAPQKSQSCPISGAGKSHSIPIISLGKDLPSLPGAVPSALGPGPPDPEPPLQPAAQSAGCILFGPSGRDDEFL